MKMFRYIFFFLLLVQGSISSAEDLLKVADIHTVMQKIFAQHVAQKSMTREEIKNSIKAYIDKFDSKRIYLLETEVSPYLYLSDIRADVILQKYQNGQYEVFEELNRVFQSAILRSRILRREIEQNPALFSKIFVEQAVKSNISKKKSQFPKNIEELRLGIENELNKFIDDQKGLFGNKIVLNNQMQTLEIFEKNLRGQENGYLYQDEKGVALPKEKEENLFVTRLLKAFASTLDAHTAFYTASEASALKMRLEKGFEGVGISFKRQGDGSIHIESLLDGGPAAKSGLIQVGDTLVQINDNQVAGESLDKVMEWMQNNKELELVLLLQRQGNSQVIRVPLKKQGITVENGRVDLTYRKINDGIIGIITLHSFYQGTNGVTSENDVRKALTDLNHLGHLRGLILDLRENSGGFLGQAVKVAGLFITNGVIVISKYFNGEEHFYRDLDGKTFYQGPFVILTSRATASAAEIVAQALQDYGVALVVGDETTYGKGTIQNQTVTGEGNKGASLFKVTVGKYYTVSGKTPQIDGVKADIVAPGIFNFQHLGEQYLDHTVKNDKIQNEYIDDLADVTPNLRTWFLRNYMPTLQRRDYVWQKMIPDLKASSASRLSSNKDYQYFLQQARQGHVPLVVTRNKGKSSQPIDFQLNEAVNVVQEMIQKSHPEKSSVTIN